MKIHIGASGVLIALIMMFVTPSSAAAQVTIGDPGPGTTTAIAGDAPWIGQSFTVPPGVDTLTEVRLAITGPGASLPLTLSLHPVTGGVVGPAIVDDPTVRVAPVYPPYALEVLTLPGGLAVVPGEVYLIRANTTGPGVAYVPSRPNYYAGGQIMGSNANVGIETYFTATFTSTPAVPTLGEWAFILMAVMLAGGGAALLGRRQIGVSRRG